MHYNEVFDSNKTLTEGVDNIDDQVSDQLYSVLFRMAVDIRDLKKIVLQEDNSS